MDFIKRQISNNLEIQFTMDKFLVNLISVSYEPPRYPWHTENHSHNSYEIHFIPSGKGVLKCNNKEYKIVPNTLYITGPDIHHEQFSDKLQPMTEYCIRFEFKRLKGGKETSGNYQKDIVDIFDTISNNKFWFGNDEFEGAYLCKKIIEEMNCKYIGCYHAIKLFTEQIILGIGRAITKNAPSGNVIPNKNLYTKRRLLLDEYFREYNQSTDSKCVAEMLGVSTRQFNRIMLEYYKMPYKEKITKLKIDHAKELLLNTDMSIKEIAVKVGYATEGYFCKLFKKNERCTPSQFREKST